ncbi:MAG TPA: sigma 54-interacting transcriptional regulator [Fibrobacteria bacterium]|nr:sigma 54-interacting transcriptional regulator [Fibrobacteria bacterium]
MASFGIGAQLIWESGDHPPYPLNKVITTLGRNESNDIFLDDPKVSSFHGNILNREDGFHLLDLKSRNGTLVNGKTVSACTLQDGDAIAFGDIRLRFKALTPFPQTPMPLARLNQKIHTMAIQSPGLRKEAEEILREVERHQDFLKSLVETVSALTESRTVAHLAEKLAESLTRKLECRSVCLAAERSEDLPKPCALGTAPWESAEAKTAAAGGARWLKVSRTDAGWRVQLAFQPAPDRGWVALLADGIPLEPKEEARDLLDMILLFASVLWRNLQEIESLHRQETGRLLDEKDRESRGRIEDLQRQNRELDDFLRQMRNRLVFADGGPMEKVQSLARKFATVDLPVLITGETGTGKTYIAKLIHHFSARAAKPFLVIDCATLPANLIESELFGHEKGAFTGAMVRKSGKVEACAGGTLFLDEIGDLPLELQGKLLRFVQEGRFERLGGNETVHVDVRIVAATNYDLQERVKAQKFRQDLFYRLHVLPLLMPPLRARTDDIPVLARHFIQKHFGQASWTFTPDALDSIRAHAWPGNVRELENKLQRAWLFHAGNAITAADLGLEPGPAAPRVAAPDEALEKKTLEEYREEYETALLRRCLRHYRGNITKCAEHLQISRNTCKSMLRKYKLVGDQDDPETGDGAEG